MKKIHKEDYLELIVFLLNHHSGKWSKEMKRVISEVNIVRDKVWHQWVVKAYDQNGTSMPEAYYYTDSKEDAQNTAKVMLEDK